MKWLQPGLFLAMLVFFAGPAAWQGFESNRAGLEAMACLRGGAADSGLPPFFRAVQFACLGAPQAAETAFLEAVAEVDARLDILRAHNPQNLRLAESAVRHHPDRAQAYFWLGDALLASGQEAEAVQVYETGLALEPAEADTWVQLGRLYEAQGELRAAGSAFSQACRYVDQGKNGCPSAGRVYLLLEEYELAEQRYRASLYQLPYYERSFRGLVDTLIARAQTAEGLRYVESLASQGDLAAQQALQEMP